MAPREDGIYNDDQRAPAIGRKILCSSFQGVQDGTMQNSKMQWLLLSSSGSRPCPGQLQKTSRSTQTQRHSLVSGLDLEIDSIITSNHHHPPTHHPPENFFEQNNIEISSFMNSLVNVHSSPPLPNHIPNYTKTIPNHRLDISRSRL